MPSRYIVKDYLANKVYHVYNRGVEKRQIFLDEQDYQVFLYLFKDYLSPPESSESADGILPRGLKTDNPNLDQEVDLLAFSLMPNHFHLLLLQKTKTGMMRLLQRSATRYAIYFNQRYQRVGPLFQSRYKAIQVELPSDILFLSFYLHFNHFIEKNPTGIVLHELPPLEEIVRTTYTSLPYFLAKSYASWLKPNYVLEQLPNLLSPVSSYEDYIRVCQKKFNQIEEQPVPRVVLEDL